MLSLKEVARRLNGEVVGSNSVNFAAIGYSPTKRNVTATFNPDGGLVICARHTRCTLAALAEKDRVNEVLGRPAFAPSRNNRERPAIRHEGKGEPTRDKSGVAAWLWRRARPVQGTIAEHYLRHERGIACMLPPTMRFLPPSTQRPAALVTAFAIPREPEPETMKMDGVPVRAIHRVFLNPNGTARRDEQGKREKAFLCSPAGLPLVVAPWTETARGLVIAEGVEDALSGHEATGLAAWAGGTASHMAKLAPAVPEHVEAVTIVEDKNDAGRKAPRALTEELVARGIEVMVVEGLARD